MYKALQRFNTTVEALKLEVTGLRTVLEAQARQIAELQADRALRDAIVPVLTRAALPARPIRISLDAAAIIPQCVTPGSDVSTVPPISRIATRPRGRS
jgi:hypothetical protein